MMEGKTVRNMWSVASNKIKFDTLVHLVGFPIEIHDDALPDGRQISMRRVETIILQQPSSYIRKKAYYF